MKLNNKKVFITLIFCIINFVSFGQLSNFSIFETSGLYGINKTVIWSKIPFQITPPIFQNLSNFNSEGLSIATRKIPLLSILDSNKSDTIFHLENLPDKFLFDYRILHFDYENIYLSNGIDTLAFNYYYITAEECMYPNSKNYMDSNGNYYLNTFPILDTLWNYLNYGIEVYGIIDTNGKILQPLKFEHISFEKYDNHQNIFSFAYKNKVGFMDSTCKIIITAKYDNIFTSPQSREFWFYMDENESIEFYHFIDNLCKVSFNHKLGVIDIKGNVILPFIFQHIYYEYKNSTSINKEIIRLKAIDFEGNSMFFDKLGLEIKY